MFRFCSQSFSNAVCQRSDRDKAHPLQVCLCVSVRKSPICFVFPVSFLCHMSLEQLRTQRLQTVEQVAIIWSSLQPHVRV